MAYDFPKTTAEIKTAKKVSDNPLALASLREVYKKWDEYDANDRMPEGEHVDKLVKDFVMIIKKYPDSRAALSAKLQIALLYFEWEVPESKNKKFGDKILYDITKVDATSWEIDLAKLLLTPSNNKEIDDMTKKELIEIIESEKKTLIVFQTMEKNNNKDLYFILL